MLALNRFTIVSAQHGHNPDALGILSSRDCVISIAPGDLASTPAVRESDE